MLLQSNSLNKDEGVVTRLSVQPSIMKFGTLRHYQIAGLNFLIRLFCQ